VAVEAVRLERSCCSRPPPIDKVLASLTVKIESSYMAIEARMSTNDRDMARRDCSESCKKPCERLSTEDEPVMLAALLRINEPPLIPSVELVPIPSDEESERYIEPLLRPRFERYESEIAVESWHSTEPPLMKKLEVVWSERAEECVRDTSPLPRAKELLSEICIELPSTSDTEPSEIQKAVLAEKTADD